MTPDEFDECFLQEYSRVTRSVILMVGDPDLGREIAQEAFVRLYERWNTMLSPEHARRFAFKAAANLARSHVRRVRRLVHLGSSEAMQNASRAAPKDRTAEVDDRLVLRDALARLSSRQRACVVLVDYAGFDAATVAKVLRMRPATVYVHLSRGRRSLGSELASTSTGKEIT